MADTPKKKKPRASEEAAKSDPFVIQFTALTMIMLAFFILLNSMASVDERRKLMALGSLVGSFGILPEGTGMYEKGFYVPSEHPILPGVDREVFLRALGSMFQGSTSAGKVRMQITSSSVVLSFQSDYLFPSGVTEVNPAAFSFLDEVARAIRLLELPVRVEGHTDASPGRTPQDNWRISAQRAISVLRYLRDGCRVPDKLLSAAGFADTRPTDGQANAVGPVHRRVEIVIDGPLEIRHGR